MTGGFLISLGHLVFKFVRVRQKRVFAANIEARTHLQQLALNLGYFERDVTVYCDGVVVVAVAEYPLIYCLRGSGRVFLTRNEVINGHAEKLGDFFEEVGGGRRTFCFPRRNGRLTDTESG